MRNPIKFCVLFITLLISIGVSAQLTTEEVLHLRALEEKEIIDHGPSIDVPYAPASVTVAGNDCTDPFILNVADGMSPLGFTDATCGRADNYDASYGTCVFPSYYTNGEDAVYELNVADDMWLEFTFDPVENYSSFWIMEQCPDVGTGNICLTGVAEYANTPKTLLWEFSAGTYYIQIDSWPSPNCISFDLDIDQWIPPPPPDSIYIFPYLEDFESCLWPSTMEAFAGAEAHAVVSSVAGFNSSCGVLLDGNTHLDFYAETNDNCDHAFNFNYPDHTAQVKMNYTPDGSAGALNLDFDFQQLYSNADYYSWFRVTVDGMELTEENSGEQCMRSPVASGSGWSKLVYDLSEFQTPGQNYNLVLDFVGKYNFLNSNGSDAVMIDNVHLWYTDSISVENLTINNGQTECFDATSAITVAGSGTTVDIMSGGETNFIAGQEIRFRNGFHAYTGSIVHGYITQTGEYCYQAPPIIAIQTPLNQVSASISELVIERDVSINISPNPTLGQFTIDFMGRTTYTDIILMNFQGNRVLETRCEGQDKTVIDIGHIPVGMYIIIVKSRSQIIIEKIIKN